MSSKLVANRRQKILNYISRYDQSPLIFRSYYSDSVPEQEVPAGLSIRDAVKEALMLSRNFGSYNPSINRMETTPGRMRSSLDIWRHLKSYYPDIDIFSVMEAIYQLRRNLYGHYCITVKRAVFKWANDLADMQSFYCNDYHMTFNGWKKLHEASNE